MQMNKFFLATKNAHKVEEFRRMVGKLGIEVLCETDLDHPLEEVEETGTTFKENALIKARAAVKETGLVCIADDSGLCVDALSGEPGVYSARYAGAHGDDAANRKKLLDKMKNVPEEERTAHFSCAIACVFPDGREFTVEGKSEGKIAFEEKGTGGFGYDSLFLSPVGRFSEITGAQKDAVSHRGAALKLFCDRIQKEI